MWIGDKHPSPADKIKSCFADKFVTEITILHEKNGNETIFITAKNERLL